MHKSEGFSKNFGLNKNFEKIMQTSRCRRKQHPPAVYFIIYNLYIEPTNRLIPYSYMDMGKYPPQQNSAEVLSTWDNILYFILYFYALHASCRYIFRVLRIINLQFSSVQSIKLKKQSKAHLKSAIYYEAKTATQSLPARKYIHV